MTATTAAVSPRLAGFVRTDRRATSVEVEEQFLLVAADGPDLMARGPELIDGVPSGVGFTASPELTRYQVESVTPVSGPLSRVREQLLSSRLVLATQAGDLHCRLLASGAPVLGSASSALSDDARYQALLTRFGPLVEYQGLCGSHLLFGVEDRDVAALALNHVRPWLATLLAVSANSPYWDGRDTGAASHRALVRSRLPGAGVPPIVSSAADYDAQAALLVQAGAAVDRHNVCWYARLLPTYSTMEVRVADVCLTVDDAVLLAGLTRALCRTAVRVVLAGQRPPRVDDAILTQEVVSAAREGVSGIGVDVWSGERLPQWQLVERLVAHVGPALEEDDDAAEVRELLAGLEASGCGADRQRAAFAAGGPTGLVSTLAEQTLTFRVPQRCLGQATAGPVPAR